MREVVVGTTDYTIDFFVADPAASDGSGKAGILFSDLTCFFRKGPLGAATALTLKTQTIGGAHDDGGLILVHDTNMPGLLRLDLSDAMIDTLGAVKVYVKGALIAPVTIEIAVINEVATSAQVDAIGAASGGSVNIQATEDNTGGAIIDGVTFVGSVQSGTFANTEAEDGVLHDIDDDTDDIDIVYGFAVGGGRTATEISFAGFVQGNGDEMKIKVYDHVGADWETIATISGQNGTSNVALGAPLLLKHTGTGAELGKVYIRYETDSTTPSNLSVDQQLVAAVSIGQSVGYANGSIWIDTVNGVAGTESFVNGVADNPVDLLVSAKTLSTAVGVGDFHVINGSSITLAESTVNESYFGDNWGLALGGQDVTGAHFQGANVSGTQVGACEFDRCEIGSIVTIAETHIEHCGMNGTITLPVGSVYISDCHHEGSFALDFGSGVGNTTVHCHKYAGGIELQNFGVSGTDVLHLDGQGKLTLNANCTGGTINLRGNWEIDAAGTTAVDVTVNYDDQSQGYDQGSIWIDTVNGVAGTNDHINGTADNPVLTIADAFTLKSSTGIPDFHLFNGSSITLAASAANNSFFGDHWTLALGGQVCGGIFVEGATVSGVGTSAGEEMHFEGCDIGTASVQQGHFDKCGFTATLTMTTADDYEFHGCYNKTATAAIFTKTAGQAITAEWVDWSGSIPISGGESGDADIIAGTEIGDIILNGADGTVEIRGIYKTITDNRTGTPTLTITGAMKASDLALAGAAADPLLNAVPGTYASGTAGNALGKIASSTVVTVSPVSDDGETVAIVIGDDYTDLAGTALSWSNTTWPSLTGGTVAFEASRAIPATSMTIVSASEVKLELGDSVTEVIVPGSYNFSITATLSNGEVVTLVRGTLAATRRL